MTAYRWPGGRIVVFAKAPIAGGVKTRLGATVGMARAATLYRRMTEALLAELADASLAPVILACAPGPRHSFFLRCRRRYGVRLRRQWPGDLGLRMHRAIAEAQPADPGVVLVGSDCPGLDRHYIDAAFAQLAGGMQAVLGPSQDGGYVLVGLQTPTPAMFRRMRWSNPRVLARSRLRLTRAAVSHSLLAPLLDIDTRRDWQLLRPTARSSPT